MSGAPNPASPPVSGWIQPIVMFLVPPEDAPGLAPLMLELHACSSPPPPTTAAPTPAARSRPRRLMPPAGLVLSDCALWSLMCNRSPLRSHGCAGPRGRGTPVSPRAARPACLASCDYRHLDHGTGHCLRFGLLLSGSMRRARPSAAGPIESAYVFA